MILLSFALLAACGGASSTSSTTGPATQSTAKTLVNVDARGVGLGGFDPIAYGKFGKPVTGTPEHAAAHGGATYLFSSDEHKAAFDGAQHAPQYGGYCAYAASQNRLSPADPMVFELVDGKLLVFTNAELREKFLEDPAGNKAKADANWPGLVAKHGR